MARALLVLALTAVVARLGLGQRLVTDSGARTAEAVLERSIQGAPRCIASWPKPALDYGFRFIAPIHVWLPLRRFAGVEKEIAIVLRVVPEGRSPVYFADRLPVAPGLAAEHRASAEIVGAVLLGPGRYALDMALVGQSGSLCAVHKGTSARLPGHGAGIKASLAPGEVAGLTTPPFAGVPHRSEGGRRLTVLLHAQGVRARAVRISPMERNVLLGTLASLMRESGFNHFRVVAFNLNQQAEVFRQDELDAPGYTKLADTLEHLNLGTVSVDVLQHRKGAQDLLAQLVTSELSAQSPSDAVVFVGWTTLVWEKPPQLPSDAGRRPQPRFYYFNYQRRVRYGGVTGLAWREPTPPDLIELLVKRLGGHSFDLYEPRHLAAALRELSESSSRP